MRDSRASPSQHLLAPHTLRLVDDARMSKLDEALDAPLDGAPTGWLWRLRVAAKEHTGKVPARFEEVAIAGMARAAAALGDPKNGWGIGFARIANVGADLLAICPTERLARCVLGLAALSGIGGDEVTAVRKLKSRKAIAAALAEFDKREGKAKSYPAMREAMSGYVDEVFPPKSSKSTKREPAKPLTLRLHLQNGKVLLNRGKGRHAAARAYRKALRATTGPKRKGRDERWELTPDDVSPKERAQLVGILAKAFGLKAKSFGFDDVVSGTSTIEVLAETAQTPIEWWDVVDDKKRVRYQLWHYHADCGSLVVAGTTKPVGSIIQHGFGVEVKDPDHQLARAMEAAHADLRKRCPKSELAGVDFSVDEDGG